MRKLYEKYKDMIPYLFFGVCTTLVNIVVYLLCYHIFSMSVMPSTITAWVAAVVFAYFTNRKWVFHAGAKGFKEIAKEVLSFFGCRIATGVLDWAIMFVFVDRLQFNGLFFKVFANVLVIVLNYVASKFFIFKRESSAND